MLLQVVRNLALRIRNALGKPPPRMQHLRMAKSISHIKISFTPLQHGTSLRWCGLLLLARKGVMQGSTCGCTVRCCTKAFVAAQAFFSCGTTCFLWPLCRLATNACTGMQASFLSLAAAGMCDAGMHAAVRSHLRVCHGALRRRGGAGPGVARMALHRGRRLRQLGQRGEVRPAGVAPGRLGVRP
jgi:hypothetical protein